jgi:uncharacterized membrane protein
MWSNFYVEGGWGMYPVTVFGFLLVVASALYAFRPERRFARLSLVLGLLTVAAGALGTVTGLCNTFLYLQKVEHAEQLGIMALGMQESLHNVILALVLVILAGIAACVGVLRTRNTAEA